MTSVVMLPPPAWGHMRHFNYCAETRRLRTDPLYLLRPGPGPGSGSDQSGSSRSSSSSVFRNQLIVMVELPKYKMAAPCLAAAARARDSYGHFYRNTPSRTVNLVRTQQNTVYEHQQLLDLRPSSNFGFVDTTTPECLRSLGALRATELLRDHSDRNLLNSSIPDNAVSIEGLATFHADRSSALSGKSRGGSLCLYINNNWSNNARSVSSHCSPDTELLTVNCRPFYLPR
ncbi:hypothetical protein L3Q82_007081 [Scortum barcoo]|uniref:Uncharacterized protein n=1 Tax=Scortum barcoo TaxID=214431 RepID=A0ACB8WV61_9TELE|nr:hypothetical protein L3Q82_007081 [Scortum barcoo]